MNQRTLFMFYCFLFAVLVCDIGIALPFTTPVICSFLSRELSIYTKRYPIQTVTTITCNTVLLVVLECYDL